MNIVRDEILTKVMNKCWHESELVADEDDGYPYWRCKFCKAEGRDRTNTDFSTPDGFFELWNWLKVQDDGFMWEDFWATEIINNPRGNDMFRSHIDPDRFANEVCNFLINKDK